MGGACSAYGQNKNKYVVVVKKGGRRKHMGG